LGCYLPLPEKLIATSRLVEKLYVVEEGDAFLEEQIRSLAWVAAPSRSLRIGELDPDRLAALAAEIAGNARPRPEPLKGLPPRPPVLCPGCSHRGVFYGSPPPQSDRHGRHRLLQPGAFEPLSAMDTVVCMARASRCPRDGEGGPEGEARGVIGDSTFFHSGITGLLNMVYNRSHGTVVVLDNQTTR